MRYWEWNALFVLHKPPSVQERSKLPFDPPTRAGKRTKIGRGWWQVRGFYLYRVAFPLAAQLHTLNPSYQSNPRRTIRVIFYPFLQCPQTKCFVSDQFFAAIASIHPLSERALGEQNRCDREWDIEWKERKRRTYWIDQRVPTTLLPYFLPSSASPNWCTLSPNSPIEKKEIRNDRTRPMKADQGFYSLAKRAHYSASITEAKAMRPIDQPKSILIKE